MEKKDLLKKIAVSIVTLVLIFGALEASFLSWRKSDFEKLPAAPDSAEGFGDFRGFPGYLSKLGYAQNSHSGSGAIYTPYTITALKPDFGFKTKNIDYTTNSLGFRSNELTVPKPESTFRIFILGGSTVQGGFNDDWTISKYLGERLSFLLPERKIEVVNGGVVGYFPENELILLQTKILDLEPDLVVFFDGRNDLYYSILPGWQKNRNVDFFANQRILDFFVNAPSLKEISAYLAKVIVKKSAFLTDAYRKFLKNDSSDTYPETAKIKDEAVAAYLENIETAAALLELRGVRGLFVFQPTSGYCKDSVSKYERTVIDYLDGVEKTDWLNEVRKIWPEVAESFSGKKESANIVFDEMTCLFEGFGETAYVDSVHYVPASYRLIGENLAETIAQKFFGEKIWQ